MSRDPRYVLDWYAINFSLAALDANEWIRLRDERVLADARRPPSMLGPKDTAKRDRCISRERQRHLSAQRRARELSLACVRMLETLDAPWWRLGVRVVRARKAGRGRRRALRTYLADTMLPAVLVLLAGVLEPPDGELPAPAGLHELRLELERPDVRSAALLSYVGPSERLAPRAQYNLACVYATWGRPKRARALLTASLAQTAPSRRHGLAHRAATDPTLRPVARAASGTELLSELGVDAPDVNGAAAQP